MEPASFLAAGTNPQPVTNRRFLQQFTGGREDRMAKYIGMFLKDAPVLLQKIEDALAARDLPRLRVAAHSLKPQLSYMGVKEEDSHIVLIEQTAGEEAHAARLPELVAQLKSVCNRAFAELQPE